MRIAIDKHSIDVVRKDGHEYIYIFDKEPLEELIKLKLHCIYYKNADYVDINLTGYDIDCIKKSNINEKDYDKLPNKKDYKIAIIIPNYNYEEWLEKCLKSIIEQTYKNYEIIFVDDMSTDNSIKIAKSILKPPHKVIELKQKRLNGGARNEAYLHISDDVDYIYYVDSDDWLKNKYVLEKINNRLQMRPDVLFVGMDQYNGKNEIKAFYPDYKDKYDAILGWSGSCGKVIKKELATRQECLYNEGTLKEDKNQHRKICIYMNSFANLKEPVYVWNRTNTKSVTTVRDKIVWKTSTIRHYADTLQLYLSVKGKDPKIDKILEEKVNITKQEMLRGGDLQY
jgi:glycosyltransferase involved in cell wall biosynthesis